MLLPGKSISWSDFFRKLKEEYREDRVTDVAGAVTFFAMLSLFPFLLFAVSLLGFLIDPHEAQRMVDQLRQVAPPDVATILGDFIQSVANSQNAGVLTLSIIGALWTASGGVMALIRAFNIAYDVEERRPFWKVRLIALTTVVAAAGLILLAFGTVVVLPAVARFLGDDVFGTLRVLRLPIAGILVMFLLACLYSFLPDVEQRFRLVTFGSVVGVVLWLLASWGFSLYVQNFGKYGATYGALGGVIVMLLWMWLSALAVLLGAEVNALLEHTSPEGRRAGAESRADRGPSGTRGEERAAESPTVGEWPQGGQAALIGERVPARQAGPSAVPPRTRVGSRKKKVGKLELAVMGLVAMRSLRRGRGRGRPRPTVH